VPAGYTTSTEAKLAEVSLALDILDIVRTFDLAPDAKMPSAVALWE
jgi:hypothetical protein